MKNKWVRLVVTVLLGAFVVSVGGTIGGTFGDIVTIIGGVAVVYGIVDAFKKEKSQITTISTPQTPPPSI